MAEVSSKYNLYYTNISWDIMFWKVNCDLALAPWFSTISSKAITPTIEDLQFYVLIIHLIDHFPPVNTSVNISVNLCVSLSCGNYTLFSTTVLFSTIINPAAIANFFMSAYIIEGGGVHEIISWRNGFN